MLNEINHVLADELNQNDHN